MFPSVIAHADWGVKPNKRWMAVAVLQGDGSYLAGRTEQVGETGNLFARLRARAEKDEPVVVGFDFPIGIPRHYAEVVGIDGFLSWLPGLGSGVWQEFYNVAETPDQISPFRPFYPYRTNYIGTDGTPHNVRQAELLQALKTEQTDQLRRLCEKGHASRRAACPLFWTVGAQQVGKAAITGWRELLAPGLADSALKLHIWPFSGQLADLLRNDTIIAVETYPAEFYHQLDIRFSRTRRGSKSGKRVQGERVENAGNLLAGTAHLGLHLVGDLKEEIEDGFGANTDGEDRFDAFVGLLGMLKILRRQDVFQEPKDLRLRNIEGWIFGQRLPD